MTASVVLLAGPGESTAIVYNALVRDFEVKAVILEAPVSARLIVRRRIKTLGLSTVAGQIAFRVAIAPFLKHQARRRINDIKRHHGLDDRPIPLAVITQVESVNDRDAIAAVASMAPAVIVVNGTRILRADVICQLGVPIINAHAGITPGYRGVHGAYWAFAEGDATHAGVTIHLIDSGIDTGAVLAQAVITAAKADNYASYPYLQLAAALPLLQCAVQQALQGSLRPRPPLVTRSKLWSHPTVTQYLWNRLSHGVK